MSRRGRALKRRYGRAAVGGGPYTIESENRLLGSRQHRKAMKYETLEDAQARAKEEAARSRSFAHFNVLNAKGAVVATYQGEK
jgi:hypothetical protein